MDGRGVVALETVSAPVDRVAAEREMLLLPAAAAAGAVDGSRPPLLPPRRWARALAMASSREDMEKRRRAGRAAVLGGAQVMRGGGATPSSSASWYEGRRGSSKLELIACVVFVWCFVWCFVGPVARWQKRQEFRGFCVAIEGWGKVDRAGFIVACWAGGR